MDGVWVYRRMERKTEFWNGCINANTEFFSQIDRWMDVWIDKQMDGSMDGWMDGWVDDKVSFLCIEIQVKCLGPNATRGHFQA